MKKTIAFAILVSVVLSYSFAPADDGKIKENITCQQAYELIQLHEGDDNFVIIDFRPIEKYRNAYLENAIFYDVFLEDVDGWLDKLDREKTYLLYCTIGHRSGIALEKMKKMGFESVYHMYEGVIKWKELGYETLSLSGGQMRAAAGYSPDGLYLGQKPPGNKPEVFAPGIVSIEEGKEYKITFSPDLGDIFFTRRTPRGRNDRIYYCSFSGGKLTTPEIAPFGYDCLEMEAHISHDGKRVYFASFRPLPGEETKPRMPNVWVVDRTADGWGEPRLVGSPLNDHHPVYMSFENDGTLYFTNLMPREIQSARLKDGRYVEFTTLPDEVNYVREVAHPAVAPDGSYIIVDSYYDEDGAIVGSLYISFRKPDGTWTRAVSMKDALKATDADIYASARVTPDGKYIFFEKYIKETDKADIYWVSADVIDELRE